MTKAEKDKLRVREWRVKNPERNRATGRACYWRNPEKRRAVRRRYSNNVNDQYRKRLREWSANKRASDPRFKLLANLRVRLRCALRGKTRSASTVKLLGCTIENLWIYLESRFQEGMTRENYGTFWEVDHIIPCALFDLMKEDHQRRCFHFSNLQPLTLRENRSKGARLINQQIER